MGALQRPRRQDAAGPDGRRVPRLVQHRHVLLRPHRRQHGPPGISDVRHDRERGVRVPVRHGEGVGEARHVLLHLRAGVRGSLPEHGVALGGVHHGQLVRQEQEGAHHGSVERAHLRGEHPGFAHRVQDAQVRRLGRGVHRQRPPHHRGRVASARLARGVAGGRRLPIPGGYRG